MTPDSDPLPQEPAPSNANAGIDQVLACAENCAKKEPLKCTAIAFLVGIVLSLLPLGAILGAVVRLAVALVRPVLVMLGAMKVIEEIERRRTS